MGLGTSRGTRRVVVGAREAAGGAAAQARSRGSATTEGSVNGLNPAPGVRPVRVLSACGGLNPARHPPGALVAWCPSGSVVQNASESRAGMGA